MLKNMNEKSEALAKVENWLNERAGNPATDPEEESEDDGKRKQTTELFGVALIRVRMWVRTVLKRAGCDAREFPRRYVTPRLSRPMLWYYEDGERFPSDKALGAIENGQPTASLDNRPKDPFKGCEAIFAVGPDGIPLWDVLEGGEEACYQAIADALEHIPTGSTAMVKPVGGLGAKIEAMYALMLHGDSLAQITSPANGWPDLSQWVNGNQRNLLEVEADELAADNATYSEQIQQYSLDQLVAVMALWIQAWRNFEYVPEATYLLQGVFYRAVDELLPEIADDLREHFHEGLTWLPVS